LTNDRPSTSTIDVHAIISVIAVATDRRHSNITFIINCRCCERMILVGAGLLASSLALWSLGTLARPMTQLMTNVALTGGLRLVNARLSFLLLILRQLHLGKLALLVGITQSLTRLLESGHHKLVVFWSLLGILVDLGSHLGRGCQSIIQLFFGQMRRHMGQLVLRQAGEV